MDKTADIRMLLEVEAVETNFATFEYFLKNYIISKAYWNSMQLVQEVEVNGIKCLA